MKDERVVEILNTAERDPAKLNNIIDTLLMASKADKETLQDYLNQKQFQNFGQKLYSMSIDLQEFLAQSQASFEFNQSLTGEM
jgi:carbonic anhydrase